MAEGLVAADLDHFGGGVDGDDLLGALGQQQSKSALARAQIGDDHGRHQAQQGFGHALPGLAGHVILAEAAGHGVKEAAHLVLALAQDAAHGGLVGAASGISAFALRENLVQRAAVRGAELVKIALAGAAVFDQAGLL